VAQREDGLLVVVRQLVLRSEVYRVERDVHRHHRPPRWVRVGERSQDGFGVLAVRGRTGRGSHHLTAEDERVATVHLAGRGPAPARAVTPTLAPALLPRLSGLILEPAHGASVAGISSRRLGS